jgi:hypothetical protein
VQFRCVTAFRMDCRSALPMGRLYGADSVPNTYVVRLWRNPMPEITSSVRSFVQFIRFPLISWVMWLNPYCRHFLSSLPVWDHHVICVSLALYLFLCRLPFNFSTVGQFRRRLYERSAITDNPNGVFVSSFSQ